MSGKRASPTHWGYQAIGFTPGQGICLLNLLFCVPVNLMRGRGRTGQRPRGGIGGRPAFTNTRWQK